MSEKSREVNLESTMESGMESREDNLTSKIPVDNPASNRRKVLEWFREKAEPYQYINLTELGIRITRDLLRDMQTELIEPEEYSEREYGLLVSGDKPDSHEWYLAKGGVGGIVWDYLKSQCGKPRLHTHPTMYECINLPSAEDYLTAFMTKRRETLLSHKGITSYPTYKQLSEMPKDEREMKMTASCKVGAYLSACLIFEDKSELMKALRKGFGIRFYSLTPKKDGKSKR